MKRAIIFDLDGTLLNTIGDLNNTVNLTYKYFNINKVDSIDKTMVMVGHGIKNLVEQMFIEYPELTNEAYKKFLEIYDKEYYKTTIPYDGIKELIDNLITKGIKIGVNSNKNDSYTKKLIEIHFSNINMDYVLGKKDNINFKPDPMGVNLILKKMNVLNSEALYIGDSPTDIKTALNANIDSASVTWGFRSKQQLIDNGAIRIINKPSEILNILQ